MSQLKEVTEQTIQRENLLLYIHTPFCGTCHVARAMLEKIETLHDEQIFYEMNASFYPDFMQQNKIESVPCLLIKSQGKIKEKIYAFRSIANIYHYLLKYEPKLFSEPK